MVAKLQSNMFCPNNNCINSKINKTCTMFRLVYIAE